MPRKSATVVSKRKAEEMQEEPPSRERSLTKKVKKNNFAEAILGTAEVDLNLSEKFAQNILSPTKSPSKSVPKTKPATRKSTKKLDIESPKHEEAKNSDDELVFKRVGRPKKSENKKKKITETPEFNDHIDAEPTPNKIQTRTKTKTLPRNSYFDELFYTGSDDEKDKKVPTPNKSKSASNTPVKGRGRPKVIKEDEKPSKIEETSKPESKQPGRKRRVLVELPVPSAEDFLPSPIIEPDEKKEEKSETDKPKRGRKSKTPNDKSPTKSKSKNKEKSETLPSETPTSSKKRGRPPKNKSVEDSASKSQKKKGKKKDKDGDNDSEEPATPPPKSIKKKPLVEEDDSDEENAIGSKSRLARPTSSVNRVKIVGSHHKDKRIDSILKKIDDAVLKLQEYTLPDKIPCREQEKEIIQKFIEEGLANDGLSHCLYISGVPGIGKTISVLEILKQIREENKKVKFLDLLSSLERF